MINSGTDDHGFFGTADSDLAGLLYTDVITLDPSLYADQFSDATQHFGEDSLTGTVAHTVTINGISQTFTWDLTQSNSGKSYLSNSVTQGLGSYDQAYQLQNGTNGSGRYLQGISYIYSSVNAFNLGLSYDQNWSYNVQKGDLGETQVASNDQFEQDFYFNGTPTFIAINSVAAVPEPETYAMLLAGIGMIGFITRRRRNEQT